jgi:hypothetical protein
MNVKRGAQGFSIPPGLIKANRRRFPLQPICAGRKEVLTTVGRFMFRVLTVGHQRAAIRKIIKLNLPDEIICTTLRLHDEKRNYFTVREFAAY